jgi:hypothetical protein
MVGTGPVPCASQRDVAVNIRTALRCADRYMAPAQHPAERSVPHRSVAIDLGGGAVACRLLPAPSFEGAG